MSRTVKQMQRSIELMLNEVGADQTVNRVTLQCLLLNLAAAQGPEILEVLKQQVLDALSRTAPLLEDPQGGERRKQLTIMRAEQLFQQIQEAVGQTEKADDHPAQN